MLTSEPRIFNNARPRLGRALPTLVTASAALALTAAAVLSEEQAKAVRHHAIALVGKPAAGAGFEYFSWVRPDAPKGGEIKLRALGTFDNLNRIAQKGVSAAGLALLNAPLMVSSLDESSTMYGLVAEWISYPSDFSSATFGLRPEARFNDGKPITSADVSFSFEAIKAANQRYALYFKNVVKAVPITTHEIRFEFDRPGNRELPVIVAGLPILPKHYWASKDVNGTSRDLANTTLEAPLGAGPYHISRFEAGRSIVYERVKDWWAKDLAVTKGQYNFDRITYIYYRDRLPAFEGFKAGETDFWPENSAKGWATEFDFEAVNRGLVKRELIPDGDIRGMQGFVFNVRRPQFRDRRVREAFNLAFNFEWFNQAMFYSAYRRSDSYFGNSELSCRDLPKGEELAILKSVAQYLPTALFQKPFENPINRTESDFRGHLRRGAWLLEKAGWELRDGILTDAAGHQLQVEILLIQPNFERLALAYKRELAKLGIAITVRVVDASQYISRVRSFDFDIIVHSFPQSNSPGNEQRGYWGSVSADQPGSRNLIGIKNPAVDAIVEKIIYAKDRSTLVSATRALDRTLLWEYYLVPQFYSPNYRIAYWDKFDRPKPAPRHADPSDTVIRIWWYDQAAAKRLQTNR